MPCLPRRLLHCFIFAVLLASTLFDNRVHAQQTDAASPPGTPPAAVSEQPVKATAPATKAVLDSDGTPATVVDGDQVQGILGRQARSTAGEDMGRIVDVLVDRAARVRAAIIDFGGFLGVGSRQIAVSWSAIRFAAQGKPEAIIVDLTRDQLRVAPAYKAGEQIVLLGPPSSPKTTDTGSPPAAERPDKEAPPK